MERFYGLIVGRPRGVLLLVLLVTAFLGYHARNIQLDSSIESLLAEGDPSKAYYEEIRNLFGSDEIGVVAVVAPDVYTP
ncbi:MAG: hypothetical protein ACREQ9_18120, partial [Candidatus Binatia bacterium]